MAFDHLTPFDPEKEKTGAEQNSQAQATETQTSATQTTETQTQATQTTETAQSTDTQPDVFFDSFNKRYNTTFKSDDEIKPLFELPKKITEYEEKVKNYSELEQSVEKYKQELEESKANSMSDLLNDPLIRKAFVASQLKQKYPDRDEFVMQEIAMSDIDRMSDIDAIAKEKMATIKGLTFEEAKLAKLADFGIDPTTSPEEWDSVAKARVKIAGAEAKERIKGLLNGIQMPQVQTKEQKETLMAQAKEEKIKLTAPLKEKYKQFDKYVNGKVEFVVPDEFKAKLDDVFQGFFIDSGLEVNEKTLAAAEKYKRDLFLEEYLPKIIEVAEKQAVTTYKEQIEKELHNDKPLNTATATDQNTQTDEKGVGEFFRNQKGDRAKKI